VGRRQLKGSKPAPLLKAATSSDIAVAKLGGLEVGAKSQALLERGLDVVSSTILQLCAGQRSITRPVISKLVRDQLGLEAPEQKILSAVMGRCLRFGQLDCRKVAATSGEPYRILIHSDRIQQFDDAREWVAQCLRKRSLITVRDIEAHLYEARQYNSWSACSHLMASLVYAGQAEFIDQATCQHTPGLERAVSNS
jgi:hypothetical protein